MRTKTDEYKTALNNLTNTCEKIKRYIISEMPLGLIDLIKLEKDFQDASDNLNKIIKEGRDFQD